MVTGDAIKIRRIVQNLVLNAIKYTRQGGVSVSWGQNGQGDTERWFIQVKDTGLVFMRARGHRWQAPWASRPIRRKMSSQTRSRETLPMQSDQSAVSPPRLDTRAAYQQEGEGIGGSFIVKRLCGLLDATIEVDSRIGEGTTFRVLLPKKYAS